jgi:hypothetical protein
MRCVRAVRAVIDAALGIRVLTVAQFIGELGILEE